ncbi:hypothetical protein DXG03_004680, partial [Asterophora parasitica]
MGHSSPARPAQQGNMLIGRTSCSYRAHLAPQPNVLVRHARELAKTPTATLSVLATATAIVATLVLSTPLAPESVHGTSFFGEIAFTLLVTTIAGGYICILVSGEDLVLVECIVQEGIDVVSDNELVVGSPFVEELPEV